jgi:HmuY protein
MKNLKTIFALIISSLIFFNACRKKEVLSTSENYVAFENTEQGITATENTITVKLKLLNPTNSDVSVILNVTELGVVLGTDYTITPTPTSGKLTLTIPSGSNETSFKLTKVANAIFDGDEKLVFDIYSSSSPVFIGVTKQFTLSFAELVASNASLTVNGGGSTYGNKVFLDISANRQTTALRTNWDLGFYNGSDDYRIILNSSLNMMAKQINKTDLNTVTTADTIGFANDVSFSQTAPLVSQLPYIDYPNGDLARTAIASISTTASDNKVYIINRGNAVGTTPAARGWKKIRILRNANGGYTLQHADIAATNFTSIDITKDDATFFKQVSFENGVNIVEPAKKKWDLAWTYFANATNFGAGDVPYMFQDVILLNRNAQIAKVLVTTKAFADFNETDIANQNFITTQNAIATDWRSGGGPGLAPSVRTDRYYILKDSDNNYYKLRFTALTQNGERGYPAYEAVLVKRG